MKANRDTITTMGIISDEVYASKNQPYFKDLPDNPDGTKNYQILKANNHTYKVLDHTPASDSSFNALLLQDTQTGKYVIAFRGTQEKFDIADDIIMGIEGQAIVIVAKSINTQTTIA